MYSLEDKVKWLAILSRVSILILQFVSNILIPDHDAGVFKKPIDPNVTNTVMDNVVQYVLGGLSSWDAQYFLHIAQYGYTYENTLAFFPFFPLLVRQLSYITFYMFNTVTGYLLPFFGTINMHSSLLLTAVGINNLLFVKTTINFFRLSVTVLNSSKLAYVSAILFCFNPASIFFSAAYSESLYCFLVFYALLRLEQSQFFVCSILIGLSGLTRSNGIINIGFICYNYLKLKIDKKLSCVNDIVFSICVIVSAVPFSLYQLYCYSKYCLPGNVSLPQFIHTYAVQNNFKLPGNYSVWCSHSVPFAYSFVQSNYWNVGFLNYYELKQIPNFALALPVLVLVFHGSLNYFVQQKSSLIYLGLKDSSRKTVLPISAFAYVVHCFALGIFALLMIHIQVTTRLVFSSTPVPYWFGAWLMKDGITETVASFVMKRLPEKGKSYFVEGHGNGNSRWKTFLLTESFRGPALWVKYYFLTYFFVGTLMFSNFLPWT